MNPDSSKDTPTAANIDQTQIDALLEQARSAAEQAIEFAKLSQEQAKLARDLNAQARLLSGTDIRLPELDAIQQFAVPPSVGQSHDARLNGGTGVVSTASKAGAVDQTTRQSQSAPSQSAPSHAVSSQPASQMSNAPTLPAPHFPPPAAASQSQPADVLRSSSTSTKKSGPRKKNAVRKLIETQRTKQRQPVERLTRKELKLRVRKSDLKRELRDEDVVTFVASNWNSLLFSGAALVVVLLVMAFLFFEIESKSVLNTVMASFSDIEAVVEEDTPTEIPLEEQGEQQEEDVPEPEEEPEEEMAEVEEPTPEPEPVEPEPQEQPAKPDVEMADTNEPPVDQSSDAATAEVVATQGARSEAGRAALLKKYGGTAASESAVQYALDWFARHQMPNGAWNFNVVGKSGNPGNTDNAMGATSYVLLSYLGAGQTHQKGKYKRQVMAGLNYLLANSRAVPAGADFRGANCEEHDNFYVQGAAATVLCEAYAMTRDRKLRGPAQGAVNFICNAQDPRGGGWRYEPRTAGSTSVTGLQIMALKAATQSGFKVPAIVGKRAQLFFDSVRSEGASGRYGYTAAKPRFTSSTTAIALLSRMYLGWDRNNPELANGVAILSDRGPQNNLYYCYYGTQVLHQWGGSEWTRWNDVMRDSLVADQIQIEDDPAHGSWSPRDRGDTSVAGGRLFTTCLATMTLEVYYRYLPLYDEIGKQVAEKSKGKPARSRAKKSTRKKPSQDDAAQPSDKTDDAASSTAAGSAEESK